MADEVAMDAEASNVVACPASAGVTDRAATGAWSGVMATSHGSVPALIGAPAVLLAVAMGVTVPSSKLTTSAVAPSGVTAMALGSIPTDIGVPAVLEAMSIGVTVLSL